MSYLNSIQHLRPSNITDYDSDDGICDNDIDIENQYDNDYDEQFDMDTYRPENPMFKILLLDGNMESDNDYDYEFSESNEESETEVSNMIEYNRKRSRTLSKENLDRVNQVYCIPNIYENDLFKSNMTINESESVCSSLDFEILNTFPSNYCAENMISFTLAATNINGNS